IEASLSELVTQEIENNPIAAPPTEGFAAWGKILVILCFLAIIFWFFTKVAPAASPAVQKLREEGQDATQRSKEQPPSSKVQVVNRANNENEIAALISADELSDDLVSGFAILKETKPIAIL